MTHRSTLHALAVLALTLTAGCASPAPATPPAPAASPAAPAPAATEPPSASTEPTTGPDAYLAALRAAGVPVSTTGESEVLIAQGVCGQIAQGVDPDQLAAHLSAGIPTLTAEQARTLVQTANDTFC